jgi:hypothetical protein
MCRLAFRQFADTDGVIIQQGKTALAHLLYPVTGGLEVNMMMPNLSRLTV